MNDEVALRGIDGANPLGFLAAVGTLSVLVAQRPQTRLAWRMQEGKWRPVMSETHLQGTSSEERETVFIRELHSSLHETSDQPFAIDSKLPFSSKTLAKALREEIAIANADHRRSTDILAAYGSEAIIDDKGGFEATAFCMVRSGDSAGNGLPAYARQLRQSCGEQELSRTLFKDWDYLDEGPSLRWDPLEDRRYALTWIDPKKDAQGKPVMIGANVLALEALALYPSVPSGRHLQTTGFHEMARNRTVFTWPIWQAPIGYDEVRSLVGSTELRRLSPDRSILGRRGIVEVFRSERIAPNQYYKNFTPARPV